MSTPGSNWRRSRLAALGAVICGLLVAAPAVQASEYHYGTWDIGTNYGRSCWHGLNGAPLAPSLHVRDIETETSIACNFGGAGVPAAIRASLYMSYDYGTEVNGLGYGGSFYNGYCEVYAYFCNVRGRNQVLNVPSRYEAAVWMTYLLPTSGTEAFTSYPQTPAFDCIGFWRNHDGLNGWHVSGLNCYGEGAFNG